MKIIVENVANLNLCQHLSDHSVVQAIEAAIDKLSRHHVRHIKAYDPNEGEKILKIIAKTQ